MRIFSWVPKSLHIKMILTSTTDNKYLRHAHNENDGYEWRFILVDDPDIYVIQQIQTGILLGINA